MSDSSIIKMAAREGPPPTHEEILAALARGHNEAIEWRRDATLRFEQNEAALKEIKASLAINTALTQDIRDGMRATKLVAKAAGWVTGCVVGAAALWTSIKSLANGG